MRSAIVALALGAATLWTCETAAAQSLPLVPAQDAPQCRGKDGYAADFAGRRTFMWRPQWIEAIAADADSRQNVLREAARALDSGPYSVTDKPRVLPGATANHYASIGPYWWPDPKKRNGLPYFRRDGEVNPERSGPEFDKNRLSRLGSDLKALSLAYYLTQEERYADHAALLLRAWFLDPETRMLPNMDFAQGIPGRVQGRGEGIIEASDLSTILEAVGLLSPSPALSARDHAALRQWYADFATWMATSAIGEDEMRKTNNHGVFFDFYLAHFALFAGLEGVTTGIVDAFPQFRLATQMDRQGRFIAELKRTRSWHYANYVVAGAARLATIGECVGKDLWRSPADSDGRNLETALAFLTRYAGNLDTWPFPDTDLAAARRDRMEAGHRLVRMLYDGADAQGLAQLP